MYYIVRHGQTEGNKLKTLQGRSNRPLNELGMEQAKTLGEYFADEGIRFDRVYSSPLERAKQTARLAAGDDAEIIVDDRIIEIDYGPYEGASLMDPPEEIKVFFADFVNNPQPEGIEPLDEIVARMGEFLEEISGCQGNVLISTHAIAMKGGLEYLDPEANGAFWSRYIANCSVYAFDWADGEYQVPQEIEY